MFTYRKDQLYAEDITLIDIARRFGTPCYVYSRAAIEKQWSTLDKALSGYQHLICYAAKANSTLAVLNILARLGSGFDIVSGGELARVIKAGGDPQKIVFSGVGKTPKEMQQALGAGIKCFNLESVAELKALNQIAETLGQVAPISLRINPDIDADTHPYIATGIKENKFGIDYNDALASYQQAAAMAHIKIIGIDCHIGSQITNMAPFKDALTRIMHLVKNIEANDIKLNHIDIGGGLGICYQDETPPSIIEYAQHLLTELTGTDYKIIIEPGRSIVGEAGVLITRVEYLKTTRDKNFAVVDAAMNDLLRPSLYNAWHQILPLHKSDDEHSDILYDIVGPICESSDFLAKARSLNLQQGDLLAICSTGAYGFTMASNYNSRPKPCEIMVDGDTAYEIRQRENITEMMNSESMLPE